MKKYQPIKSIDLHQRSWPSKRIEKAPVWCSVDLRDGNQALRNPMTPTQKIKFFKMLLEIGFKEIEISFPSASRTDFEFTRTLISEGYIPDDVTIQVLTQARKHLIDKTFQAIGDARRCIVHLYNSTSPAQREIVFRKTPQQIIALAVDGVKMIRGRASEVNCDITLEYSPESFSQTELSFASDICNAVIEAWAPDEKQKIIINLPSTVEVSTANVFADQIEYMSRNIPSENVILSVHTHNDRGCAVAAAELAQLAGAHRVEGTLFGNGERTGNADIIALALNCYAQGIDPGLSFTDISKIESVYRECTGLPVSPRHPYAGELVFTAFSGSHQDAISKGLASYKETGGYWNIPYLPIDPKDIGRDYESVIRINSQSGKGGTAYILKQYFGLHIPKELHPEIGAVIQKATDDKGAEMTHAEVFQCIDREFINVQGPFGIDHFSVEPGVLKVESPRKVRIKAGFRKYDRTFEIEGAGNGLIDALTQALNTCGTGFKIVTFHEHSLEEGSEAKAVAYIQIESSGNQRFSGIGTDTDIAFSSLKALISALNRSEKGREENFALNQKGEKGIFISPEEDVSQKMNEEKRD